MSGKKQGDDLTRRKIAIWLSKNCQKVDLLKKKKFGYVIRSQASSDMCDMPDVLDMCDNMWLGYVIRSQTQY